MFKDRKITHDLFTRSMFRFLKQISVYVFINHENLYGALRWIIDCFRLLSNAWICNSKTYIYCKLLCYSVLCLLYATAIWWCLFVCSATNLIVQITLLTVKSKNGHFFKRQIINCYIWIPRAMQKGHVCVNHKS